VASARIALRSWPIVVAASMPRPDHVADHHGQLVG
jgi:hypothetical protein